MDDGNTRWLTERQVADKINMTVAALPSEDGQKRPVRMPRNRSTEVGRTFDHARAHAESGPPKLLAAETDDSRAELCAAA